MLVSLVAQILRRIGSPLEYPWLCLSGGRPSLLARRLLRLSRAAGDMLRRTPTPTLPVRLQIETTDRCNFACVMCARRELSDLNRHALPLDAFHRLIDLTDPFYVTLNGLGEPLLDPTIFQKLKHLHQRGVVTSMPTNGTLTVGDRLDLLAGNLPTILQLSVDGATKKSFEAIRRPGHFDTVIGNYRAIAARCWRRLTGTRPPAPTAAEGSRP